MTDAIQQIATQIDSSIAKSAALAAEIENEILLAAISLGKSFAEETGRKSFEGAQAFVGFREAIKTHIALLAAAAVEERTGREVTPDANIRFADIDAFRQFLGKAVKQIALEGMGKVAGYENSKHMSLGVAD